MFFFIFRYREELSGCRDEIQQLRRSLAAAQGECSSVSEERLKLQQEILQLRKMMDDLRKVTTVDQKKAELQVGNFSPPLVHHSYRIYSVRIHKKSIKTLLKLKKKSMSISYRPLDFFKYSIFKLSPKILCCCFFYLIFDYIKYILGCTFLYTTFSFGCIRFQK